MAFGWLWLGRLNGVLALKILTIFWMGTLWRVMALLDLAVPQPARR
ncbi:MAG TPA: hypothetical protein VKT19_04645 [Steroidobacteraceae bacterium]|nr:hypothetical protein [Steroidobacteraceae bacterium]